MLFGDTQHQYFILTCTIFHHPTRANFVCLIIPRKALLNVKMTQWKFYNAVYYKVPQCKPKQVALLSEYEVTQHMLIDVLPNPETYANGYSICA